MRVRTGILQTNGPPPIQAAAYPAIWSLRNK